MYEGVPTVVFQPIIERLVWKEQQADGVGSQDQEFNLWVWIARRTNLGESTVRRAFEREVIDFDLADLLLVGLGRVDLWRVEPLKEIYLNQKLTETCANQNCGGTFEFQIQPRKMYCSELCRSRATDRNRRHRAAA